MPTILITGASRGIGAATVELFAAEGWDVVAMARSADALEDLAAAHAGRVHACPGDVADPADLRRAAAMAVEATGRLDVLVNNAGLIEPIARIEDADPAAWGQVIDVNLKGVFNGITAALPHFRTQGGGTVVNISSGAANAPIEGWSHYCASKAAVKMLTAHLHKEEGENGIRSIGLSPGTVATDMQRDIKASGINPVSRLDWDAHIPPNWGAKTILFLTTPKADDWLGQDFSLKTEEGRKAVGLPPQG